MSRCSKTVFLLDHLVGADKQSSWNSQSERLSGFQIEVQLDFGCLLHRQISGFFTYPLLRLPLLLGASLFENASDVDPDKTESISNNAAVTHQSAGCDEFPVFIDGWDLVMDANGG